MSDQPLTLEEAHRLAVAAAQAHVSGASDDEVVSRTIDIVATYPPEQHRALLSYALLASCHLLSALSLGCSCEALAARQRGELPTSPDDLVNYLHKKLVEAIEKEAHALGGGTT